MIKVRNGDALNHYKNVSMILFENIKYFVGKKVGGVSSCRLFKNSRDNQNDVIGHFDVMILVLLFLSNEAIYASFRSGDEAKLGYFTIY